MPTWNTKIPRAVQRPDRDLAEAKVKRGDRVCTATAVFDHTTGTGHAAASIGTGWAEARVSMRAEGLGSFRDAQRTALRLCGAVHRQSAVQLPHTARLLSSRRAKTRIFMAD